MLTRILSTSCIPRAANTSEPHQPRPNCISTLGTVQVCADPPTPLSAVRSGVIPGEPGSASALAHPRCPSLPLSTQTDCICHPLLTGYSWAQPQDLALSRCCFHGNRGPSTGREGGFISSQKNRGPIGRDWENGYCFEWQVRREGGLSHLG